MSKEKIKRIEAALDSLIINHPLNAWEVEDDELAGVEQRLLKLSMQIKEATEFSVRLSAGDVDAPTPNRSNFLASGLKQLQAQMMHLTWQAQCVANGDYKQRIDFMGEFSEAFNRMVEQLDARERRLKEQQAVMERVFNLIDPIVVMRREAPQQVLYANDAAQDRLGLREGHIIHDGHPMQSFFDADEKDERRQVFDRRHSRWYGIATKHLTWNDQTEAQLYLYRDITRLKERELALGIEANTDALTKLSNRRAFDLTYGQLWDTCKKAQRPISVLVFDLDFFKSFNDTYGHMAGDSLLAAFGEVLRKALSRKEDLVARYGGEEFIAALPFTDQGNAMRLANQVCAALRKVRVEVAGEAGEPLLVGATASCGVTTVIPTDDYTPSQLMQRCDQALYKAKQSGRDRVFYQAVDGTD